MTDLQPTGRGAKPGLPSQLQGLTPAVGSSLAGTSDGRVRDQTASSDCTRGRRDNSVFFLRSIIGVFGDTARSEHDRVCRCRQLGDSVVAA